MSLPFTEAFTPAAGVLANPPWTQAALAAQTLNYDGSGHGKASAINSSLDVFAYDNSNTYNNDQYGLVTISGGLQSGNNFAEVLVRCSGTSTTFQGYSFNTDGSSGALHTVISKWVSGAPTDIANFATTFTTGDVMRLEIVGTVLTAYKNGVSLGTFNDTGTTITSGAPGCGAFNSVANNITLDTFEGGNTGGAAFSPDDDSFSLTLGQIRDDGIVSVWG